LDEPSSVDEVSIAQAAEPVTTGIVPIEQSTEAVRAVSPSATVAPFTVGVPVPPAPGGSGPVLSNVNPISWRSGVSCRCRGCGGRQGVAQSNPDALIAP
jgi:hypothetical protein